MTIACPECGTLEEIPRLLWRDTAVCIRCQSDLEKTNGRSIGAALACSLATLLLLVPVNVAPLLRVDIFSMHSQNITAAGVAQLWARGWILLAGLSALFVIIVPFLRFGLLSAVLAALRLGRRPSWLGAAFRWSLWLDPWAMIDVYLLAGCVGYYRLINIDQARITIELGGACFIAAAFLTMLSRATLDKRTVWRAIGGETHARRGEPMLGCTTCDLVQPVSQEGRRCPRCGARLRLRKLDAAAWTAALLAAALVLIFPANIYPMNISNHLGQQVHYTIMTGVQDLFKAGLYPLGVLIFCTSILTPGVKILALGWCVLSVWRGSRRHLVVKTKVLRLIAEVGRWSKTDPFAIVFFVPLVHFGSLGSEDAGWGATAFMLMTFLLIHKGMRARLARKPPLVGSYVVSLEITPGAQPAAGPLTAADGLPQIPVAEGGGIGGIVTRVNKIPIGHISRNLVNITSHVSALTSSPQLKDAVVQLDAALRQIHGMTAKAGPQVPVVIARLRRAAADLDGTARSANRLLSGTATQNGLADTIQEINQTARAVRSLADYLDRHPEALLRGRGAKQ